MKHFLVIFLIILVYSCLAMGEERKLNTTQPTQAKTEKAKQAEQMKQVGVQKVIIPSQPVSTTQNKMQGIQTQPQRMRQLGSKNQKKPTQTLIHPHGGRSLDQGGETCETATVIASLPYCDSGTTVGHEDNQYEYCVGGTGSPDVCYSFVPTTTVTATVSLAGSDFDTYLEIWASSSPCAFDLYYNCNNDAVGLQSCLQNFIFEAGNYYLIIVDGNFAQGNYNLNISLDDICHSEACGVQPAGEDCASAGQIVVQPNGITVATGTTVGADVSCTDHCDWDSNSPDVFYFFTLTECRRIAIKLESGDSHITIYQFQENCCVNDWLCNDDATNFAPFAPLWDNPSQHPSNDYDSYVAADFLPATYYIRVGMYGDQQAPYTLTIYDNGSCANAGEDCASAGEISTIPDSWNIYAGTTEGADVSCTDDCEYFSFSPDVFYYFTLTECRRIAIKLESGDSHISVYQGIDNCCVNPILCDDDWGNFAPLPPWDNPAQHPAADFDSYVAADLRAGTYYVRCGMYQDGSAPFTLTIYDNGSCGEIAGDNCSNAIYLASLPAFYFGNTVGLTDDYSDCYGQGVGAPDIVFSYTPTQDVLADILSCGQTYFNSTIYVYRDGDTGAPYACSPGSECHSYNPENGGFYGNDQLFCVLFEAGHSYCIVLDGNVPGDEGDFTISFDSTSVQSCNASDYCGVPRETEPNNSACPTPQFDVRYIHPGDTIYGNICNAGDKDYFRYVFGEDTSVGVGLNGGPSCDQIFTDVGLSIVLLPNHWGGCYEFLPCNDCGWGAGDDGPDTVGVVVEGMGDCKTGKYKLVCSYELVTHQPCDPGVCTSAVPIACNSTVNVNTCGGCDIIKAYYRNGISGQTQTAGTQVFYKFNVTTATNYTIDVSTDSTAAWNQNVQFMVFTNCALPKTSCVYSQDQNDYINSVTGPRNVEHGTVLLTPGTYYLAASISADYPYGTHCGDISVHVGCTAACLPADSVVIRWNTTSSRADVTFRAPQAGNYLIYSTTDHNLATTPPGTGWTLETTQTVGVGRTTWTDPTSSAIYKRYVIVHNCP